MTKEKVELTICDIRSARLNCSSLVSEQQLTEKIQRIDNNIFLRYGLPVALVSFSLIVTEE